MFMTATGWLGWPPDVALDTDIHLIALALEGKIDFLKKTNPWGSKDDDDEAALLAAQEPDPAGAQKALLTWVKRQQARKAREGSKAARRKRKTDG